MKDESMKKCSPEMIIHGKKDSAAEWYASENGFRLGLFYSISDNLGEMYLWNYQPVSATPSVKVRCRRSFRFP
jgi:hypothetical protein